VSRKFGFTAERVVSARPVRRWAGTTTSHVALKSVLDPRGVLLRPKIEPARPLCRG
jgi:hypothetical protein